MNDDWWLTIDDPVELGKVIAERALIAVIAMKTVRQLLIDGLKAMGADGLYSLTGCDETCGCGLDDLIPCGCSIDDIDGCCFPAKKIGKSFYPMEEQ